jgi:polyribonucleotide nucleotidyltransferase
VANPSDELNEGQEVMVKCIGIDEKSGKIKLSRKALIPKPEGAEEEAVPEGGEEPRRDRRPRPRRN